MPEQVHKAADVFGITRDVPINYVERAGIDDKLIDNLTRDNHLVIFGSSKQGKTCLRKHCLQDDDYVVVSCQNNMDLRQLHAAILKSAGYQTQEATARTVDGRNKLEVSFTGGAGIPGLASAGVALTAGTDHGKSKTAESKKLELDAQDPNDIIAALKEINFTKFIVLEDFHYLPLETQNEFSFALKAFHENSKITFIIVAVWKEENRLILFNGDLTGRVIAIDADAWTEQQLAEVINTGEALLNIRIDQKFTKDLIAGSFNSVYIVQEACLKVCSEAGVAETRDTYTAIDPKRAASEFIREIVQEQSGRYKAFLTNFSTGFQVTELEMFKWLLYPVLVSDVARLQKGLKYREIRETIQKSHPKREKLNPGNITQALQSVSGLQSKKNIKPFVLDYDSTNLVLSVVDKGFFVWIDNQDRDDLLDHIDLPRRS